MMLVIVNWPEKAKKRAINNAQHAYAKNRYCHFWLRASSLVIGKTAWCGEDSLPDEGRAIPPLLSESQEMSAPIARCCSRGATPQFSSWILCTSPATDDSFLSDTFELFRRT